MVKERGIIMVGGEKDEMKNRNYALSLLAVLVLLVGCAHIILTPKQTVLWGMNVYNAQYDLYIKQVAREDLTEDEKEVLRTKKDILLDMEESINVGLSSLAIGENPDEETLDDLTYLVNRLLEDL
jgi:hypothetical protein